MYHAKTLLFYVYRWKEFPELEALCNQILEGVPQRGRKGKTVARLKRCLRVVLSNLQVSHLHDIPVRLHLANKDFASGFYKKVHIAREPFKLILRSLREQGLMEFQTGYKTFTRGELFFSPETGEEDKHYGRLSRIWPSDRLRTMLDKLDWLPERELSDSIILREKIEDEDVELSFREEDAPPRLRDDLEKINSLLRKQYFTYAPVFPVRLFNSYFFDRTLYYELISKNKLTIEEKEDKTRVIIDDTGLRGRNQKVNRFIPQIRAIFTGGKFTTGGRLYANCLYGESWQSMPLEQRKTIQINSKPVVELDYSSFHIAILYALKGIQLTKKPYEHVADPDMRVIIKVLLLAALNADSVGETVNAMNTKIFKLRHKLWLSERDQSFLRAYYRHLPDWRTLIAELKEAHAPIAEFFGSGAGVLLQRIDAEIMCNILLILEQWNVPALPVHDSVIVPCYSEWRLKDAMDFAYMAVMGPHFDCPISKK